MAGMLLRPVHRFESRRYGGFDLVFGWNILDLLGQQLAQVPHGAQLRQTQGFSYSRHHCTQHASRPSKMIEAEPFFNFFFSVTPRHPALTR